MTSVSPPGRGMPGGGIMFARKFDYHLFGDLRLSRRLRNVEPLKGQIPGHQTVVVACDAVSLDHRREDVVQLIGHDVSRTASRRQGRRYKPGPRFRRGRVTRSVRRVSKSLRAKCDDAYACDRADDQRSHNLTSRGITYRVPVPNTGWQSENTKPTAPRETGSGRGLAPGPGAYSPGSEPPTPPSSATMRPRGRSSVYGNMSGFLIFVNTKRPLRYRARRRSSKIM